MKRRKIMMLSIFCSQVSLNLNDISSHTKQMGETSRLVQQVIIISKCHPKVSVSYWIQILNISILWCRESPATTWLVSGKIRTEAVEELPSIPPTPTPRPP